MQVKILDYDYNLPDLSKQVRGPLIICHISYANLLLIALHEAETQILLTDNLTALPGTILLGPVAERSVNIEARQTWKEVVVA